MKIIGIVSTMALLLLVSCGGVSEEEIAAWDASLKGYKEKGVPGNLLSTPKVLLSQIKNGKKKGYTQDEQKFADSLVVLIAEIDTWLKKSEELAPKVTSYMSTFNQKKSSLTGLHLKAADSSLSIIKGFADKKWYHQANDACQKFEKELDVLVKEEAIAQDIRKRIVGKWKGTIDMTDPDNRRIKATRREQYYFMKDGSIRIQESLRGQTAANLKEDWKFDSQGTYSLKGDMIHINITREKCLRQVQQIKDGNRWLRKKLPTYDKEISDGKKDRYVSFNVFKQEYRK